MLVEGKQTTWAGHLSQWLQDNAASLSEDELAEIAGCIRQGKPYKGGGGAEPEWQLVPGEPVERIAQRREVLASHFEQAFAFLHLLRDILAAVPMGDYHLLDWSSLMVPSGHSLQLFPADSKADNREQARNLARAIGENWKREGDGAWKGTLKADPRYKVILHAAEPATRELEAVEL